MGVDHHLFGQLHASGHEKDRQVDAVESDDVFSYDMCSRPWIFWGCNKLPILDGKLLRELDRCQIVEQGIEPDINLLGWVVGHLDSPGEPGRWPGHTQVCELSQFELVEQLNVLGVGKNKVWIRFEEANELVLELGQTEKVVRFRLEHHLITCLFRDHVLRAVRVDYFLDLGFWVESLVTDGVPARVVSLIDQVFGDHEVPEVGNDVHVVGVGCSDEAVVFNGNLVGQFGEVGSNIIDQLFGVDTQFFGGGLDLESVLVCARGEERRGAGFELVPSVSDVAEKH